MIRHEHAGPPTVWKHANGKGVQVEETRIAVVMVGLPARGKSLIAQKGTSSPSTSIVRFGEADVVSSFSGPLSSLAVHTCKMLQCGLLPSK